MTNEKMIRDALGSPVPQVYSEELEDYVVVTLDGSVVSRGDINFNRTKLLRDLLGSVIPQLWDPVNNKWVVDTGQGRGGSGNGESGPVDWVDITNKPNEFTPIDHTHEIADIDGLEEELEKVFTQVSSGKSLLETAINSKGTTVTKATEIATFSELEMGILAIKVGSGGAAPEPILIPGAINFTDLTNTSNIAFALGTEFIANTAMKIHGVLLVVPFTGATQVGLATSSGKELKTKQVQIVVPGIVEVLFDTPIIAGEHQELIVYYDTTEVGYCRLASGTYSVNANIVLVSAMMNQSVRAVPNILDGGGASFRGVFPIFSTVDLI